MKTYWGSGGTAPHILNLGPRKGWEVSFMTQLIYSWKKSPQYIIVEAESTPDQSECSGEENNSCPSELNPNCPAHRHVTILNRVTMPTFQYKRFSMF